MDAQLTLKALEVMTELAVMIDDAKAVAQREKECNGNFCRIQDDTIALWEQTHNALAKFVEHDKVRALEWKFQQDYLAAKRAKAEAEAAKILNMSNMELAS